LEQRVERLMSIRAVGPITALTWALEIADPHRFCLHRRCSQLLRLNRSLPLFCRQTATWSDFQAAQCLAADGVDRGRQTGAALEPATGGTACPANWSAATPNRATLQVARKLVAYLLAVDKSGQPFQVHTPPPPASTKAKNKTSEKEQKGSRFAPAA
jgi:transposase